jgi:hypothetical protein
VLVSTQHHELDGSVVPVWQADPVQAAMPGVAGWCTRATSDVRH